MKTYLGIIFSFLFVFCFQTPKAKSLYTKQDSILLNSLFEKLTCKRELPTGSLLIEVGKSFLETPYVAHTLENGKDENLIINLSEFDCTTFAENCLAITRCLKMGKASFRNFKKELEYIRYRDGKRNGYCSRLHYFSEWIANNQQKGTIEILGEFPRYSFDGKVNFMSEHPDSYEVLKENPDLVQLIAKQEKLLSYNKLNFLPKSEISKNEHLLKDGDIIGITTSIPGLDIVHVGIVVSVKNRKHVLHASTSGMKVVISENTLNDFLQQKNHFTGILIGRPKF